MATGARKGATEETHRAMARGLVFKETVRSAYVEATGEKFTDEALARAAHLSVNTVRNMWHGMIPELSTLIAVSNATGLSVLDVLVALQGASPTPRQDEVATAIREQTAVLTKVLERLAPGEQTPTPSPRRAPRASRTAARMARASTRSTGADERER